MNIIMRRDLVDDVVATLLPLNHARPTLLPATRRLLLLLLRTVIVAMLELHKMSNKVEEDVREILV